MKVKVQCIGGLALTVLFILFGRTGWAQQTGVSVSGRVVEADGGGPFVGASVVLDELKRETQTAADGSYRFDNVPPGTYHLAVRADGYAPQRLEVNASGAATVPDIALRLDLHYYESVSVSPEARDVFASYQPTSVLAGQELMKELEGTIGAALENQPGVALRSFGPGPSRPVIRGFDGDRVLILEDGQRTGDLSSQSGDHGVPVNPASASRIEVVRGPATLLYGANAIGGLVNVISNDIPSEPVTRASGAINLDLASGANEAGFAGDVTAGNGKLALHAGGSGRKSGDVKTPEGRVENSQSRSGFGNVGLAWTGSRGILGASYGYDDTKYGIPFVEEGETQLTPRRHTLNVRGEGRNLSGLVSSVRATAAIRRYKHDELEGSGEVATAFTNNTTEFEVLAGHRAAGRLTGSFGGWGMTRAFEAAGVETLSPPVDQKAVAGFFYEEVTAPHATFQFGGRVDHTSFNPEGGLTARSFNNFSGSVGLLLRPRDDVTVAFSLARASRNPALEELYFEGPHPGNFAFEVGNDELESEHAIGFDVSLKWRGARSSGEITYFRNDVNNYIFRNPTGREEDGFPVIRFTPADSVLQGLESHIDAELGSGLFAEGGLDYVRGKLKASGDSLPRIPPLRGRVGLRYQRNALQLGGEVVTTAKQDRVFGAETPTDGHTTLKLFAIASMQAGPALHTLTFRLDNATNELYRNHLSYIKDFVPEMGRSFKVIYGVRF